LHKRFFVIQFRDKFSLTCLRGTMQISSVTVGARPPFWSPNFNYTC